MPQQFRILLVDDDQALCQALPEMLELHLPGVEVRTVNTTDDGLDEVTRRDYDLVLCDLVMPKENGAELAGRIHRLRPETIVLLITGHPKPHVYRDVTGVHGFIRKPFDRRQFIETMRRLMRFSRLQKRLRTRGCTVEDRLRLIRSFTTRLQMQLDPNRPRKSAAI